MPMDLKCGNVNCRIEVFKGENYTPLNTCPGCTNVCFMGGYTASTLPPVAYPRMDPIPVTAEFRDDFQQVFETVSTEVERFSTARRAYAGHMDPAAIALGNLAVWIRDIPLDTAEDEE